MTSLIEKLISKTAVVILSALDALYLWAAWSFWKTGYPYLAAFSLCLSIHAIVNTNRATR